MLSLHLPTRARGICKDSATITYHAQVSKTLAIPGKNVPEKDRDRGCAFSCYDMVEVHERFAVLISRQLSLPMVLDELEVGYY